MHFLDEANDIARYEDKKYHSVTYGWNIAENR